MDWRNIILLVIAGLVALFGAPIIQLIKNALSAVLKKPVEDRWAVALAMVVAGALALLEMWLTGQLDGVVITRDNFPTFFAGVYAVAQIYYGLFKNSNNILGKTALLTKSPPAG